MNIKEVIAVVNQMQADGVIEPYDIGGAVGRRFNDNFSAMSHEL